MTSTLGIIGSGSIGGTVARLAVDAGINVVLSNSRGPETLRSAVDALGPLARAATADEAARAGDLIVTAIPFSAVPHLPVAALDGKIVVDANNYYPARDGVIPALEGTGLTHGEYFQRHLPGARTVKTFNTIYFRHLLSLARPNGAADRSALATFGDDAEAKEVVAGLLDRLGYDAVDGGSTVESWRVQEGTPAYVLPYISDRSLPWTADPGKPAGVLELRAALEAAVRRR